MGKLFEYRKLIDDKVEGMGKEAFKLRGRIGLQSGLVISMIEAKTPDDPTQVKALGDAIKEILGVTV